MDSLPLNDQRHPLFTQEVAFSLVGLSLGCKESAPTMANHGAGNRFINRATLYQTSNESSSAVRSRRAQQKPRG